MRVLFVRGDDDYGALMFEASEYAKDLEATYAKAMFEENDTIEVNSDDGEFSIKAFEFGEVDLRFIEFLQLEILDYDACKHTNFYVLS